MQVTADGTTVSYYNADVITAKNYYPFGMQMPDSVYKTDGAYFMNGTTLSMDSSYTIPDAANNFTIEFWAKPTATHQIDSEGYIWGGIAGQRYLVAPGFLAGTSVGMGVSVGTNGVSVYEHGPSYIPALLVWQSPSAITDWIHVAVVYQNKQPKLYINGQLVRTGLVSSKQFVYPSFNFTGYGYGTYLGYVDEMRIWKEARTQQQIKDNRYGTVAVPQTNLSGYWPLSASNGSTLVDISGNNRSVPLNSNTGRLTGDVGGNAYRYGFNGKEKDNDIMGNGNAYDYGARIQDPRLGRWLSVDPLQQKYTDLSPYQYCANSPISAKDPDGRLIIFINGMWGSLFGIDEPKENYWGSSWVSAVQNQIEGAGSKTPRFYDGAIGGASRIFSSPFKNNANTMQNRIDAGARAGYNDGAAIIGGLDKGETIKIITNSMGAAFERGFTKGILKYQTEENERRTTFNAGIEKMLAPLEKQQEFLNEMSKSSKFMTDDTKKKLAGDLSAVNSKINDLVARKKEILNVKIEMVIDLSSHEINYPDPNAQKSFFMMAAKLNNWEKGFVDERAIGAPAQQIGLNPDGTSQMSCHYGPCAPAAAMPASSTKPKAHN